ncbi:MAG: PrgI family protein [Candidatus Altiarchaeota archaeon]|nr:PrgI family protein [Candidatus Altiarchaeota archaeon]
MPYEIPTNIQYEERLLGPLTTKQSIYAVICGGISIYVFFFTDMNPALKLTISFASVGIAVGVIFFELDQYLVHYVGFMRQDKSVSWISPAASRLLGIKEIKADSVFLKNGEIVAVLKITSINFGVLNKEDQDIVIYNFLQFINSIDFPIQVVMRSVNLDLSDYLVSLKRKIVQRDDQMALVYFEHFSKYLDEYVSERKINDRFFYVVVPAKKSFDERKVIRNLETRCSTIMESFNMSGIVADRMDNKQLLNFYASYFTQTFHVGEDFLTPITMYRRIWAGDEDRIDPEVETE